MHFTTVFGAAMSSWVLANGPQWRRSIEIRAKQEEGIHRRVVIPRFVLRPRW